MIKLTRYQDETPILINPAHIVYTDPWKASTGPGTNKEPSVPTYSSRLSMTDGSLFYVMETLDEIHEMCLDVQLDSLVDDRFESEGEDDDDQWWTKS